MTNTDHIRRLLLLIGDNLNTLRNRCQDVAEEGSFAEANKAVAWASRELEAIDPEALAEAYDLKALYDRVHLIVVNLRCLRVQLEKCEEAAEAALDAAKRITHTLEESESDDADL
jgi:hypothetical protein